MWDGCRLIWLLLIGLFRSRATLEAENLVLRQQIIVLRRTAPKRLGFNARRPDIGGPLPTVSGCSICAGDRQGRDCRSVASGGVSSLLALEIEAALGKTKAAARDPTVDPRENSPHSQGIWRSCSFGISKRRSKQGACCPCRKLKLEHIGDVSLPKIRSGLDSRRDVESSHHPGRCLRSCTCS